MNAISVRKVEACELTPIMIFLLQEVYHTELNEFVIMYDGKQNILYVNRKIPHMDVNKFLQVAGYEGEYINDPDCEVYEISRYISYKYGYRGKWLDYIRQFVIMS